MPSSFRFTDFSASGFGEDAGIQHQLDAHAEQDAARSLLAGALGDALWPADSSRDALCKLSDERQRAVARKDEGAIERLDQLAKSKISEDRAALRFREFVEQLSTGGLKTAALFLPSTGSRWMTWGARLTTAGVYSLDQVHHNDSHSDTILNAGLGAAKGLGMRGALGLSGRINEPFLQGTSLSLLARGLDSATNLANYRNSDGEFDPAFLPANIASGIDLKCALAEGAMFSTVMLAGRRLSKVSGAKDNPLLNNMFISSTFGFSSGMQAELARQRHHGEPTDFTKVFLRASAQAGVDGLASVPGTVVHLRFMPAHHVAELSKDVKKTAFADPLTPESHSLKSELSLEPAAKPELVLKPEAELKPETALRSTPVVKEESSGSRMTKAVLSDSVSEDGTRIIVRIDGTRVTIRPGAKPVVELPDGHGKLRPKEKLPATLRPQSLEAGDRSISDFVHSPERPLNIGGANAELIAQEMSNFENSPFILDARKFASVEGFYVWLKFSGDPVKQAHAQNLYSYEAKQFGKTALATTAEYDGQTFELGSPQHHALIKRAIEAKLVQHPDLARRFADTFPRPIIHDLGRPESPSTRLKGTDFCRMLTELRQDLVEGKLITVNGSIQELRANAQFDSLNEKPLFAVSELLRNQLHATGELPVDRYLSALEGFKHQASGLMEVTPDYLSFALAGKQVLKVSPHMLANKEGRRQFDLHILETGIIQSNDGLSLQYFIQPRAIVPVPSSDIAAFHTDLHRLGYALKSVDGVQLGLYNGGVKLLNPYGVRKLSPRF